MKKFLLVGAALAALTCGARAADLGIPAGVAVVPGFSWTGFYIGAHVGYHAGATQFTDAVGSSGGSWNLLGDRFGPGRSGIALGGQLGYNYQFRQLFVGLEADLGYLGGSASRASALSADTIGEVRGGLYGTFRGRFGVAIDRLLVFGTAGIIGLDNGARINDTVGNTLVTNRSGFRVGWTVGAGIEYAVAPNWTIKADYLYYETNKAQVSGQQNGTAGAAFGYSFDVRNTGHIARVGVNYLFSTGPRM
jgi:outer membrane immunogenic protein